ncbi:spore coat protein [Paenibacillus marinisediminis]
MRKEEKCEEEEEFYWSATDNCQCKHPMDHATVNQEAKQSIDNTQISRELILIKDSCNVEVSTTDTKVAVSIQAALQAALVAVISISLGSSTRAEAIVQDLMQKIRVDQENRQKILIENSKEVFITTTDTFIAVNIQVLFQILLALVVRIDVL